MLSFPLLTIPILLLPSCSAVYTLQDDYFANNTFFDHFTFWDEKDPTNGFVQYQSHSSAKSLGLISQTTDNSIIMSVDSTNTSPDGRSAVRITSKKSYNTALIIIDITHMPGGLCGTWPAFWTVGPSWPQGGEIDILEGVNDQETNDATLHTGPGCSISNKEQGGYQGKLKYTKCESKWNDNVGCKISAKDTNTYGIGFNKNGGGIYATEWTASSISVYFFPRGSDLPEDVLGEGEHPDPTKWGSPLAKFTGQCDFGRAFVDQQLVFTNTFCGDWAGKTWGKSSCAAKARTCEEFVRDNPEEFVEAFWEVKGLRVYQWEEEGEGAEWAPETVVETETERVYVTPPVKVKESAMSTVIETATSITYVKAENTEGVGAPEPTTFIVETSHKGGYMVVVEPSMNADKQAPSTTSGAPNESSAPFVDDEDGFAKEVDPSPAISSKTRGGCRQRANASVSSSEWRGGGDEGRYRHARHMGEHKRRSGRGL